MTRICGWITLICAHLRVCAPAYYLARMAKSVHHNRLIPVLASYTKKFGPDHPATVAARSELAYVVLRQQIHARRDHLTSEQRAVLAAELS